jgi:hypothetical protein
VNDVEEANWRNWEFEFFDGEENSKEKKLAMVKF